jgi:hypothetical protein
MWYRIFGRSTAEVRPAALLEHLQAQGEQVTAKFRGDDLGWTSAEIVAGVEDSPLLLERFLTDEDNLRDDLNTWAGYLETLNYSPNNFILMERMIQTKQLFTIRKPVSHPNEIDAERICESLSKFLAQQTDGMYQIDNVGWHEMTGDVLIAEY